MIECLILGDSIAYGVSNIRTECVAYAKSCINSLVWNDKYQEKIVPAKTTIISLGSNDTFSVKTEIELIALRSRITEGRVFWILPAIKPERQRIVIKVANAYNDRVIKIPEVSTDGVHPTYNGYKRLGELTK